MHRPEVFNAAFLLKGIELGRIRRIPREELAEHSEGAALLPPGGVREPREVVCERLGVTFSGAMLLLLVVLEISNEGRIGLVLDEIADVSSNAYEGGDLIENAGIFFRFCCLGGGFFLGNLRKHRERASVNKTP